MQDLIIIALACWHFSWFLGFSLVSEPWLGQVSILFIFCAWRDTLALYSFPPHCHTSSLPLLFFIFPFEWFREMLTYNIIFIVEEFIIRIFWLMMVWGSLWYTYLPSRSPLVTLGIFAAEFGLNHHHSIMLTFLIPAIFLFSCHVLFFSSQIANPSWLILVFPPAAVDLTSYPVLVSESSVGIF